MKAIDRKFLGSGYYYKTPTGKGSEGRRSLTYSAQTACKGRLYYGVVSRSAENNTYGYIFATTAVLPDNSVVIVGSLEYTVENKMRDENELSEVNFYKVVKI